MTITRAAGDAKRGDLVAVALKLEGKKTGDVAAVQQVTEEDEELLLISAGGQVVRTETNTINRYSSGARGVIVMRLNAGDKVVGIAAFRAGLAQREGLADNEIVGTTPAPDGPKPK
jgi:DNA gyrase subunit A